MNEVWLGKTDRVKILYLSKVVDENLYGVAL